MFKCIICGHIIQDNETYYYMQNSETFFYNDDSVICSECAKGGNTMRDKMVKNSIYGRTADIKITMKKSELEYCFKAENFAEFERRFEDLKDIMLQRFINALSKRDIMKISEYIINANRGDTND